MADLKLDGTDDPLYPDSADSLLAAQREVRHREAAWRRKRAEVARLIADSEESKADQILGHGPKKSPHVASVPVPAPDSVRRRQAEPKRSAKVAEVPKATSVARPTRARLTTQSRRRRSTFGRLLGTVQTKLAKYPPWSVSLAMHIAFLVLLALLTITAPYEPPLLLNASFSSTEAMEVVFEPIQLVSLELELESPTESLVDPVAEPLEPLPIDPAPGTALTDLLPSSDALMAEVPATDSGDMGSEGTGEDVTVASSSSSLPTGKVSFFGVNSYADRVVFVVDNSGSMQRGRMETTLGELNRAVQRLSSSQQFYVIFYSDQAYPMFFPDSAAELQLATRDVKRRFAKWLSSVEICLGGRLLDAVEMAAKLDPQVVYLMSDGDIRSQRVLGALTETDAWPFTIHTFGMEARTKQHAENLLAIAQANDGAFRVVDVRPKAILRSQAKPIRYHRKPGEVWGSQVRSWQ